MADRAGAGGLRWASEGRAAGRSYNIIVIMVFP